MNVIKKLVFYFLIYSCMKKIFIIITLFILSTVLVSCNNSFNRQSEKWKWMWRWWKQDTSDIIRLNHRWKDKMWQKFGSWSRMWSWNFMDRFPTLTSEDRQKLVEAMETKRSWDKTKSEEIMKDLKIKYPDVFSWSMMMWWWRNFDQN